eukprot:7297247-Ditylum_brightwellii.AAC.1
MFHKYQPAHNRVIWFQESNITITSLPESARFTSVKKCGSLVVCRAPLEIIQEDAAAQATATEAGPPLPRMAWLQDKR